MEKKGAEIQCNLKVNLGSIKLKPVEKVMTREASSCSTAFCAA